MRLFLALTFEDPIKKTLLSVMHSLKENGTGGTFTPSQNLHMTLVFIGETDRLSEIKSIIGQIQVPEIRITPDKLTMYGSTLVAEAKGNQKLKEYVSAVRKSLDTAGIEYDHKSFRPHITLVRRAGGVPKGVTLPKETAIIRQVSLMKSSQEGGKTIYTRVAGWGK